MLNIIGAIFSGFIVGVLARWFYPGDVPMNPAMTILLGIGGSLVAGLVIASSTRGGVAQGLNRAGCLASVLGAMALIFLGHQLGWG